MEKDYEYIPRYRKNGRYNKLGGISMPYFLGFLQTIKNSGSLTYTELAIRNPIIFKGSLHKYINYCVVKGLIVKNPYTLTKNGETILEILT